MSDSRQPARRRVLFGLLLAAALGIVAFALGGMLARLAGAGAQAGLAAAVIVAGYGLLAGLGGLLAGALCALMLPMVALRRSAVAAALLALPVVVWLTLAGLQSRAETRVALQAAYETLPAFELEARRLQHGEPGHVVLDWSRRRLSVSGPSGQCGAELYGNEAVRVLTAVRNVESVVLAQPALCAPFDDEPLQELSFRIEESKPPQTAARFLVTSDCLRARPALAQLLEAMDWVLRAKGMSEGCAGP